jgi:hypothetical protein
MSKQKEERFNYANSSASKSCVSKYHAPKICIKELVITLKTHIKHFVFFLFLEKHFKSYNVNSSLSVHVCM